MSLLTVLHRCPSYPARTIPAVDWKLMGSEPGLMTNGNRNMNQDTGGIGYILIINNDMAMRQTVSGYFSDHNFPARCVSNWSELKSTGTLPSLIIMDQPHGLND